MLLYACLGADSSGVLFFTLSVECLSEDCVFVFHFRIPPLKRNSGICWLLYLRQSSMSVSSILLPWLLVRAARAWLRRRFVLSYSASGSSAHAFPGHCAGASFQNLSHFPVTDSILCSGLRGVGNHRER